MGDKDITSKRILKNLVREFAVVLFGLPVTEVELLETNHQRIEERRADLVAKVALSNGSVLLLHIEVQNDNESAMPVRMMRYLTDIMLEYPGLPVRQYLVYIGRSRLSMVDGFDMPDFSYRYRMIDLHAVDCDELLRQDSPDAWVLAILCDFKERLPRDVAHIILSRLQQRFAENPPRFREYVEMLNILADNRDLNLDIYEEITMLQVNIERTAIYRIGMEKGIEKGVEEGARRQALDIARRMLASGVEVATVAAFTGLPLNEVETLAANPPQRVA